MEALLGHAAAIHKGGFGNQGNDVFCKIETKAHNAFGWDDERTIWAKLSIGIIYQKYRTWRLANPWVDLAYAASFAANGEEDGISVALEHAREKKHFEHLTDEGRPFKSVFGVTGLTIRPTRLHLDYGSKDGARHTYGVPVIYAY